MAYRTLGSVDIKSNKELKGRNRPDNKFLKRREKEFEKHIREENLSYTIKDIYDSRNGYLVHRVIEAKLERR